MRNKLKYICLVLGLLLIGSGLFMQFDPINIFNEKEVVEENKISLKDDYYESINYEKIKNARIPSDSPSWNIFYDATVRVNTKKELILNSLLSDPDYKNENIDKIVEIYDDFETRDELGLSELEPYFDMIDNAETIDDFTNAMLTIDKDINVNILLNYELVNDVTNSGKLVFALEPFTIEDSFEAFVLDKYSKYVPIYHNFRSKALKLYGLEDEEINKISADIDEFVMKVQAKSINITEVIDSEILFKHYTLEDIENEIKNYPIVKYIKEYNIDNEDYYIIFDIGHYKALDELYTNDNLQIFKNIAKVLILEKYATITTTSDFFQLYVDQLNAMQNTNLDADDLKEYILKNLKTLFLGDKDLNLKYEERYFTDEDKSQIRELIEEIKDYYRNVITECDWLSEDTKIEALKKLDTMKVLIGYQGTEDNKYDLEIIPKSEGGTFIQNDILSNRIDNKFEDLSKDINLDNALNEYNLDVNAFYSPINNAIVFPAAFSELYKGTNDYYTLLGYAGMIIGHEISHAFDSTGSKYDENGNLKDWWTPEDKAKYNELTEKIKNYYSKYEMYGINIDGENTLGENIADLAGLKTVLYIAEKHGATNEDYKKIFEAYANLWVEKTTKESIENQIITDTHSPNKIRVNAVLSSMDKFYEVYDITEKDGMYVPKEERVGLW